MEELFFHAPAKILFGSGLFTRLSELLPEDTSRVLLVTGDQVARTPWFYKVEEALELSGIQMIAYKEVGGCPDSRSLDQLISIAKASRVQAVVGLGGMRSLSLGRLAAVLAPCGGSIDDLIAGRIETRRAFPFVGVPTTIRNPFLLTDRVLFSDDRTRENRVIKLSDEFPSGVLIDPDLTSSLSEKRTAALLLDTFLLAVEGYFSRKSTFVSDTIFLRAIGTLTKVKEPAEADVRQLAAQAGLLTSFGMTMGRPGVGTALSWALNSRYGVPKAFAGAILLPYILEYGIGACPDRVIRMAPILGVSLEGLSTAQSARRVVDKVRQVMGVQDMPMRLEAFNIKTDDIAGTVEQASRFPFLRDLPSAVSRSDLEEILKKAL